MKPKTNTIFIVILKASMQRLLYDIGLVRWINAIQKKKICELNPFRKSSLRARLEFKVKDLNKFLRSQQSVHDPSREIVRKNQMKDSPNGIKPRKFAKTLFTLIVTADRYICGCDSVPVSVLFSRSIRLRSSSSMSVPIIDVFSVGTNLSSKFLKQPQN